VIVSCIVRWLDAVGVCVIADDLDSLNNGMRSFAQTAVSPILAQPYLRVFHQFECRSFAGHHNTRISVARIATKLPW